MIQIVSDTWDRDGTRHVIVRAYINDFSPDPADEVRTMLGLFPSSRMERASTELGTGYQDIAYTIHET